MYKQKILKNKLRFISVPMQGTKTATILILVGAGSKYENKKNNGISHFLEHMLFKGTEKRPNTLAIASELDALGAEFNAFTSKEFTGYWVKTAKLKIESATDIISDMFFNSKFDSEEINRERGVIIEEINMCHENPMMYIEDVFEECLYGDTPAGRELIGPKKNILAFQRKDFVDYFSKHYRADNTIVCLAGSFNKKNENKLIDYFSDFNNFNSAEKEAVAERQGKPKILIKHKEGEQINLSLGVRAYSTSHKDEFVLKLISIILGGSMSSRLFLELRERRGLAYYVRTQAEFYTDSGYLTTQAGVPKSKTEEAVKVILNEYQKIKNEPISSKELQKAKDSIRGRVTIQLESSDDVANWYARQALIRGRDLTPEDFFKKIEKINAKDIQRVAVDIFKSRGLNLAIIGSYKEESKILKFLKL